MNRSEFERYIICAKENREPHSRLIIPVTTVHNRHIGSLACVDRGMIDDQRIIAEMTKWRNRFMAFFLTHFLATEPRTRTWLEHVVLPSPDRLLFMIFLPGNDPVGQIGLCKIAEKSAELDNVIRGERRGEKDLAYYAGIALLKWTFEKAPFNQIALGVLSNNIPAINLYKRLGFVEVNRHTLTRVNGNETTTLVLDREEGVPESFQYVRMRLTKDKLSQKSALHAVH